MGRSPVDRVLETKEPALEDAHAEPRTALIFGGTSEIALAIANKLSVGRLRQVVVAVRDPYSARVAEGMEEQPFSADPDEVAEAAVVGLLRGRRVIWAPAPLQGVFGVLSVMPGPIWRKISKR